MEDRKKFVNGLKVEKKKEVISNNIRNSNKRNIKRMQHKKYVRRRRFTGIALALILSMMGVACHKILDNNKNEKIEMQQDINNNKNEKVEMQQDINNINSEKEDAINTPKQMLDFIKESYVKVYNIEHPDKEPLDKESIYIIKETPDVLNKNGDWIQEKVYYAKEKNLNKYKEDLKIYEKYYKHLEEENEPNTTIGKYLDVIDAYGAYEDTFEEEHKNDFIMSNPRDYLKKKIIKGIKKIESEKGIIVQDEEER